MPVVDPFGKDFLVEYPANDVYFNLQDVGSVTFVVYEVDGATSATITFAEDNAGTNAVTPDVVARYFEKSVDQASNAWVAQTQTAAETFTPADATGDLAVVTINDEMAPAGKTHVKCTGDGSSIVFAIFGNLAEQRSPEKYTSLRA